jgi:hypothetical protein
MQITAHVINVADRTDRWETFTSNWQDQTTIKIEREDAFKPDGTEIRDVYDAVFLKHREILTKAKERGEKYCLIMEDDAIPGKDFGERFEAIYEYLETHEEQWDCFNGGMLSIGDSVKGIIRLSHLKTKLHPPTMLLKATRGCMGHFLLLKVDPVLEKIKDWEADHKPMYDGWYPSKLDCMASIPFLAKQSDGFSDSSGDQREWTDRFAFEEDTMLYSLKDFIYYPSSSLSSPADVSGSQLLEEK